MDTNDPAEPQADPAPAAADGGAPPPADPSAGKPPASAPSRRRAGAGAAGLKKYSIGEKMVKTSKPPSKVGAAVKMVLILTVFLGIPGIVTAGFFFKDSKGRNVWVRLGQKLGIFKGGPAAEAAEKPIHPNLLGFDQNCGILQRQKNEFLQVRRKIELHEQEKKDIPQELAVELHQKLGKIRAKVIECAELFSKQGDWIETYNKELGEAEKVFEAFAADENKKLAAHFLLGGAVPENLKEAAQDPNVLKYVEINQKLERHLYKDFQLREDQVSEQGRDATSTVREINSWRARLPRIGEAAKTETPKPEPPKPEPEKPKPEPEKPKPEPAPALAIPKQPHPWAAFKSGAWIRMKSTVETGGSKIETITDTTLVEATDTEVTLKLDTLGSDGKVTSGERKSPRSEGEAKALRIEKLKVGTDEVECVVVETAAATGPVRTWVPKTGPAAGMGILKMEYEGYVSTVNEVIEEPVQVAGQPVKCVSLVSEGKRGDVPVTGALWFSGEVPGFAVKSVTVAGEVKTIVEVLAFGDDAGKKPELMTKKPEPEKPKPETPKPEPEKPKPDPAKPETPKPEPEKPREKTADVLLAEAGKAVIEGATLAKQIADDLKSPTLDAEQLKTLLTKKGVALSYLTQARETYTVNKDKASDPASVEKKLGLIEKVIANLQKYEEEIKSKMK